MDRNIVRTAFGGTCCEGVPLPVRYSSAFGDARHGRGSRGHHVLNVGKSASDGRQDQRSIINSDQLVSARKHQFIDGGVLRCEHPDSLSRPQTRCGASLLQRLQNYELAVQRQ